MKREAAGNHLVDDAAEGPQIGAVSRCAFARIMVMG